jgi:triosephosphate isomerase
MRTPFIGANWKMHKDLNVTSDFFAGFLPHIDPAETCEIVICPPFLDVEHAVTASKGTKVSIGAQNLYWGVSRSKRRLVKLY